MPRRLPRTTIGLIALAALAMSGLPAAADDSTGALAALWAPLTPIPEQAEEGGTIAVGNADLQPGDETTVSIAIEGAAAPGLTDYFLRLTFDPSVVELVAVQGGDVPLDSPQLAASLTTANQRGQIAFGQFSGASQGVQDGTVAELVFQAQDVDASSSTPLALDLANNNCGCFATQDGVVEVTPDSDGDGVDDTTEGDIGTDPTDPDTDDDGLDDGDELDEGTDPSNPDSDDDGLDDGSEIDQGTDPTNPDTDDDGLDDGTEVDRDTDPTSPDTDDDGLGDRTDECPTDSGPIANDGCPEEEDVGGDPPVSATIQAFPTPEPALGEDLDGDGRMRGSTLRYRDRATGEVINTGLAVSARHGDLAVYENTLVFANGTGELWTYDAAEQKGRSLEVRGASPSVHGTTVAYSAAGWIRHLDLATGQVTDPQITGRQPEVFADTIVFQWGQTPTIRIHETDTARTRDTGLVGTHPDIHGTTVAFATREDQAGEDLSGNGSTDRVSVVRVYNIESDRVINTGAVGRYPVVHRDRVAFATSETAVGRDLNGDGRQVGSVIRVYDLLSGELVNTKQLGTEPDIHGRTLSFYLNEAWIGTDRTGDGDRSDPVVRTHQLPERANPSSASTARQDRDPRPRRAREDALHVEASSGGLTLTLGARSQAERMRLTVFDLDGERVASETTEHGSLVWRPASSDGRTLANGIYLYRVTLLGPDGGTVRTEVRKLAILR